MGTRYRAGIYGFPGTRVHYYCDEDGWMVIQSRGQYGISIDYFYRDWEDYKWGFGVAGKCIK